MIKELHMANQEIIDRDTYKKIKKMNREELTNFILQYGDELLGEQGKTIDLPALETELSKIKGIGGKRLEEIMVVIEKFLDVEQTIINK
jgi:hypothetical protein